MLKKGFMVIDRFSTKDDNKHSRAYGNNVFREEC